MEAKYRSVEFTLEQILNKNTFTVPNFQRGIVWSEKKRKKFVETLISGEPFGTILVYRDEKNNNVLIDGLQRISTIRAFKDNPYKYLKRDIIEDKKVNNLLKVIKKVYKNHGLKIDEVEDRLNVDKVKNYIFSKLRDNSDYIVMKSTFFNYFKLNVLNNNKIMEIEAAFKSIIDSVEEKIKIDSLKIYGLEYNGNEEKLPDIFYNINTEGVKPSKYEVLASLWTDVKYKINDDKILSRVIDRYNKLKANGLKITLTKELIKRDGITLFEYCYAISSIIMDPNNTYVSFLGKSNKETEPIGFEILCLLLGLKVNEAHKLGEVLKNTKHSFLVDLKNVIIDGLDYMYDSLEEWIYSEQGEPIRLDSNYMIYHMLVSYIKKNYVINYKENTITKNNNSEIDKWNKLYKKNLHLHYFYDYLSCYWNEHRQVSDLMNAINKDDILYKYYSEISNDEWIKLFDNLKKVQLTESATQVTKKSKLFIDYLIKFKIKNNPKLKDRYFKNRNEKSLLSIDIEHIIPVERVKNQYNNANVDISNSHLSSIGNLCYLTSKLNRAKGENTIYEDQANRPGYILDDVFKNFVDYPSEEEIKFISYKFEAFKEDFDKFMSDRYDKLVNEFIDIKC